MTDNKTQNWHFANGEMLTASIIPEKFKFILMGNNRSPVGTIVIDKDAVSFEGEFDEAAKLFVDNIAKVWSPQWKAQAARILELEQQVKNLTPVAQPTKTSEDGVMAEISKVLVSANVTKTPSSPELMCVNYSLLDEPDGAVYDFIQRFNHRAADQSTLVDLRDYIQRLIGIVGSEGRVPHEDEATVIEMGRQCEKWLVGRMYGRVEPADLLL